MKANLGILAVAAVAAIGIFAGFAQAQNANAMAKKPAKRPAKKPARPKAGPMTPIKDVEGLPRVLLIGDSISIGYTLETRKLLDGKVNVHRILTNGGPTSRGLESLDEWLGKGKWDAIHFNWGLHDLKYMGPKGGNLADPNASTSRQQIPPDQYAKNMRELVGLLQKTGAKLIWTSTTPVPAGAGGRIQGDAAKYNAIALKIITDKGVAVDDLYALALPQLSKIQQPKNVHFTPAGYKVLARQAANSILKALGKGTLDSEKEK